MRFVEDGGWLFKLSLEVNRDELLEFFIPSTRTWRVYTNAWRWGERSVKVRLGG